jgi:hypothetical protein
MLLFPPPKSFHTFPFAMTFTYFASINKCQNQNFKILLLFLTNRELAMLICFKIQIFLNLIPFVRIRPMISGNAVYLFICKLEYAKTA